MGRMLSATARFSTRKPWLVIGVILLLTVGAGLGIRGVDMEFSQRSLLPREYPSVATMEMVEGEFGGISYAKVLLVGSDMTTPQATLAIYDYQLQLEEDDGPWSGYVLKVEGYLSHLWRNPQAQELFRVSSALAKARDERESGEILTTFLRSDLAAGMRESPDAAPLIRALEETAADAVPGSRSSVRFILDMAVREAVRRYLDSPAGSMVTGRTITADRTATLLNVQLKPDLSQDEAVRCAAELEEFTREFFTARGMEAEVSGEVYLMKDIQAVALRDSAFLGLAALLFIVAVLYLTFRRLLDVFLTLTVVLLSTLWVFGLMGWLGMKYTMVSIAIIPLLLGIDVAYSIHVLSRYYEEREKGKEAGEAAVSSTVTVGIAVFLAAATTMFGFLSFSISDLPPIRQFGGLCLAGVFFGFLLSVSLLPAALAVRDRRHSGGVVSRKEEHRLLDWLDQGLARISILAERHRRAVWAGTLVLVVACALSMMGLSTSADFRTFVPQDLPSYRTFQRIEGLFGGQDMAVALVEGDRLLSPDSLRGVQDFVEAVLADPRNKSIEGGYRYFLPERVSSVPSILQAKVAFSSDLATVIGTASSDVDETLGQGSWLPASAEEAEELLAEAEEAFGFDASSLISSDRRRSLISFQVPFLGEEGEREMAAILKDAASRVSGRGGLTVRLTGFPLIISDALGKLFSTQLETGGLALALCALLVILIFRSISYGLSATSVVFLAILLELGMLRLIDWPLDIMTVMIASLVIGAGIDFGIHVTHRFREELHEHGRGTEEAINATVRNVGKALVSAAFTTSGAFLILAISSLSPLRRFGIITAIALMSACFAALVLEPSFLATVAAGKKRGNKR